MAHTTWTQPGQKGRVVLTPKKCKTKMTTQTDKGKAIEDALGQE